LLGSDAKFEISGVLSDGMDGQAYCMMRAAQPSPGNLITRVSQTACEEWTSFWGTFAISWRM